MWNHEMHQCRRPLGLLLGCVVLGLLSGGALAAPGDIHRISGADVVNLRAGPTDASNIRGSVRVLQTGEEGWVYGSGWRRAGCCLATPRPGTMATPVSCNCRKDSTG